MGRWLRAIVGVAVMVCTGLAGAVDEAAVRQLTERDLAPLPWRSIGPANMGGRVSALAWVPGSRTAFYAGFATGGLFRTDNLGTTFTPVFDHEATASIGAVAVADVPVDWAGWADAEPAVAPEDRAEKGRGRIVWVGTGEGNNRNSSSWGNGVYRSVDGGRTFLNVGLAETHDIPAIAVDPRDPDVLWVAALGHLWGANPERGVYLTRDGGSTWEHVLAVDDETGACDVVLDPSNPDRVWAAMYARRRTPWSYAGTSTKGGVFRSDDGGRTWTELTVGLPERTGRIGLAVAPSQPRTLYAVVESDQGGIGQDAWDDRSPAGGLFRSDDGGDTWRRVNDQSFRPFYFSRLAVDPTDPERVYVLGWNVAVSTDGGRTLRFTGTETVHVDHHAIAVNPLEPERIVIGNDGGLYLSHDRAGTWRHLNNLAVAQFYHVDVDRSDPYRVGGGLQDNGSWIGPSATDQVVEGDSSKAGILNEDWRFVHGGDGFRVLFDPTDPNVVYATSQGGEVVRVHLDTQYRERLKASADEGEERLRFNWDAPFLISAHDPTVLYHAGNRVFKLTEKGSYWYAISPDLSHRATDRIMTEGSDAETFGTVTALAESPVAQGVLWAGTDDGRVWRTADDGRTWREVTPDAVGGLYVAHIEPSHHDPAAAIVAVDGHRSDVFRPIVLSTGDAGAGWRPIHGDLPPDSPVRVVREDPANPSVLYAGTEVAAYVSLDRGGRWVRLNGRSLPTTPVYDLRVHPREHDLVAGTHGRSVWILDDASFFAEMDRALLDRPLHLFAVDDVRPGLVGRRSYGAGAAIFKGANPPRGALVTYWLRDVPERAVKIEVRNAAGQAVRSLTATERPGLNRVVWDLKPEDEQALGGSAYPFVPPGTYTVVVTMGEERAERTFEVLPGPGWRDAEALAVLPPPDPWG